MDANHINNMSYVQATIPTMSRCSALNTSNIFIIPDRPATAIQYTLIQYTCLEYKIITINKSMSICCFNLLIICHIKLPD